MKQRTWPLINHSHACSQSNPPGLTVTHLAWGSRNCDVRQTGPFLGGEGTKCGARNIKTGTAACDWMEPQTSNQHSVTCPNSGWSKLRISKSHYISVEWAAPNMGMTTKQQQQLQQMLLFSLIPTRAAQAQWRGLNESVGSPLFYFSHSKTGCRGGCLCKNKLKYKKKHFINFIQNVLLLS